LSTSSYTYKVFLVFKKLCLAWVPVLNYIKDAPPSKLKGKTMKNSKRTAIFLMILFIAMLAATAETAVLRSIPVTVTQPDGSTLDCLASGDEYFNYLHDSAGHIIIQDPATGYYTYAVKSGGKFVPSQFIAGIDDPEAAGMERNPRITEDELKAQRNSFPQPSAIVNAPTGGTLNNIVVFIRFSGETEFTDAITTYSSMFNSATAGANSMKNYFKETSYGKLTVASSFYPAPSGGIVVSYQDSHPRGYYQPYNATTNTIGYTGGDNGQMRTDREHALLVNAVNGIKSAIPAAKNIDADGDGYVDSVTFIISGSPTGWSSLLWPHRWALYSQTVTINGKRVWDYAFQLRNSMMSSGVGVLCHEMFHVLGSPDLYHYNFDGIDPVYQWDVMEWDMNPPQHMGAYMKHRYGNWINTIPTITASGTYTLNPLTSSTNNAYKIKSPKSSTEYFIVEYRKRTGTFESSLPGDGLLVYRINSAEDGQGNAYGPPDEVYIYRPGGTTALNGSPSLANFSSATGRTAINDTTNPSSFLSTGAAGGLKISGVGAAGPTISFTVTVVMPFAVSISPTPATSTAGTAKLFTAVYRDSNGYADIKTVELLVNATTANANAIRVKFDQTANKLYIMNNAGTGWLAASCSPGVAGTITNNQGTLNCGQTTVTKAGNDLTVKWSITPKTAFKGTKNLYMKATDKENHTSALTKKGTWTIN